MCRTRLGCWCVVCCGHVSTVLSSPCRPQIASNKQLQDALLESPDDEDFLSAIVSVACGVCCHRRRRDRFGVFAEGK